MLASQRALFEMPRSVCYLNSASYSPLPLQTLDAGRAAVARKGAPWTLDWSFATQQYERTRMAAARRGWLEEDAESVAERYRAGELDVLDLVRHYGVILDWGTGELLPKTTVTFRAMLQRRSASHCRRSAPGSRLRPSVV